MTARTKATAMPNKSRPCKVSCWWFGILQSMPKSTSDKLSEAAKTQPRLRGRFAAKRNSGQPEPSEAHDVDLTVSTISTRKGLSPPSTSPWGSIQSNDLLAHGVWRVETAGHGGLWMSEERWGRIPETVQTAFKHPRWAEEDCEMPVALGLLNMGYGDLEADTVHQIALESAESYIPEAVPYLQAKG